MRSSPCLSIKGDPNPRISQSAFAQITLLLTSCELSCGSASSTAKSLLVPAAPTSPAAVCGWPNCGAEAAQQGVEGLVVSRKSNPPQLKYWKLPKLKKQQNYHTIVPLVNCTCMQKKMQPWAWTHTSCSSQQYSAQLVQLLFCRMGIGEINPVPLLLTCLNLLNSKICQSWGVIMRKNTAEILLMFPFEENPWKTKYSQTDIFMVLGFFFLWMTFWTQTPIL